MLCKLGNINTTCKSNSVVCVDRLMSGSRKVIYEAQCWFDPQPRGPYCGFKLFNFDVILTVHRR